MSQKIVDNYNYGVFESTGLSSHSSSWRWWWWWDWWWRGTSSSYNAVMMRRRWRNAAGRSGSSQHGKTSLLYFPMCPTISLFPTTRLIGFTFNTLFLIPILYIYFGLARKIPHSQFTKIITCFVGFLSCHLFAGDVNFLDLQPSLMMNQRLPT